MGIKSIGRPFFIYNAYSRLFLYCRNYSKAFLQCYMCRRRLGLAMYSAHVSVFQYCFKLVHYFLK